MAVKTLIAGGAIAQTLDEGITALWQATTNGHETVVKMLLERKEVYADSKDKGHFRMLLSWAARNRHEIIVKLLINRNEVNADWRSNWKESALSLVPRI